jgi:hypothetical protein
MVLVGNGEVVAFGLEKQGSLKCDVKPRIAEDLSD